MALNFDHQRDRIGSSSGNITFNITGGLNVPVGTTAQRPGTAVTGQIRFNTNLQTFEGYNGGSWSTLGGVIDSDRNTYIVAESTPNANNNELDFWTDGVQRMQIGATGNLLFGDSLSKFTVNYATGNTSIAGNLNVNGDVTIAGNLTFGDSNTDTITFSADITSDIIPDVDATYNLGSALQNWQTIHVQNIDSNTEVVTIVTNGALTLPVGTTAERPTSSTGMVRFNSDDGRFEAYDGNAWTGLGGVIDVDQNTYIIAETSPGANNNDLDFWTDGVQRLQIDETGDFLFGDGLNKFTIDWATGNTLVAGTLGVTGESTLASATISDLTSGRVVLSGTDGSLEDSANLTFDGTDLTASSVIISDLTSGRVVLVGAAGAVVDNANLTFDGTTLSVTGDLDVTGNVTIGGNITIGDANTDAITVAADFSSHLIPDIDGTYDLGSATSDWRTLYIETITNNDNRLTLTSDIVDVDSTGAVILPVGTTLERPTAEQGMIRYNTTDSRFEAYDGTAWTGLGGVIDVDQNTYIVAETSPGANNNDLDFWTDGVHRLQIDENGDFLFGDGLNKFTIDWATGNAVTSGSLDVGNIKIDTNTISSTDTNGNINITPDGTGEVVISTATVSDLTDNRIVIAGTSGSLEDDANLTFDGTSFNISNTFAVTVATGNTSTTGTLEVGSTANVTGNFSVNTNKFTVDAATGNTATAGTLDVDGATNLNSTLTVDGNVILGSAATNTVTFNADVSSDLIPSTTLTYSLGNLSSRWTTIYAQDIDITGSISSSGSQNVSGNLDVDGQATLASANVEDLTQGRIVIVGTAGELEDSADLTFDGTDLDVGQGNFTVNVATGDVYTAGDLSVTGDLTVNGTVTTVNSTTVTIDDPIFTLGGDTVPTVDDNKDRGIEFRWHDGTSARLGFFGYDDSAEAFTFIPNATNTSEVFSGAVGNAIFGQVTSSGFTSGNIQVGVTDDNEIDTSTGNLTIDSAGGTVTVDDDLSVTGTLGVTGTTTLGVLDVNGQATLSSANVEDLTANRVVLAGTSGELQDSAEFTYTQGTGVIDVDIVGSLSVDNIDINGNNIISTNTNGDINITPNGTGEVIISTATVSDLTNDRIIIAGTAGSLEDDANLTFNGIELNIGQGNLTIQQASGNTYIAGTLETDGLAILNTAVVENLVNNRIVIAGATSNLEDDANLTFDGTTFSIGTGNFSVSQATGNTTVAGTLDVTGNTGIDGDFDINTNKFTVDSSTGNTAIAGTLNVTGESTLASAIISDLTANRVVLAGTAGAIEDSANLTFNGTLLNVTGDVAISNTLDVDVQATLASANVEDLTTDRIVIVGTAGELEDDANFRFDATNFDIGPAGSETFRVVVASGNTSVGGNLTITGDLTVNGTTTTVNSTTTTVDDPVFTLGGDTAPLSDDNKDRGIEFNWYDTATTSAKVGFFGFDDSSGKFTFIPDATNTSEVFSGTAGDAVFGDMDLSSATINAIQIGISASNEIDTTAGNLVLDSTGGTVEIDDNATISGTLGVTGESTLASATVSDLTAGRMVLAGTAGELLDSPELTYTQGVNVISVDITGDLDVDNINIDGNTVSASNFNGNLNITANGTGEVVINTAIVSDLTDNRIVIAGTNSELEDDANLTFNGITFAVGVTNFTVAQATGNTSIAGTLDVTGATGIDGNFDINTNKFTVDSSNGNTFVAGTLESDGQATLASANIEDLTDNRIVIAGSLGELEDDANLTFDGTTFKVGTTGTDKFTVDVTTGNTYLAGTFETDGQATLASANIEDLTNNRIVIAGSSGELEDDANFRFDGTNFDIGPVGSETFRVSVATGNITGEGTLNITGNSTLSGTLDVTGITNLNDTTQSTSTGSGALIVDGGVGIAKNVFIGGSLDVAGSITLGGDITIGDANTDSINISADFASSLIPDLTDTYDIGSSTKGWRDVYLTQSLNFGGGTGANEIVLPTNQADALSIVNNTVGDLIVVNTVTPSITISPATIINTSLKVGTALGTTTISSILDEDNMSSNSATALATQQSIKAYVDSQTANVTMNFAGDASSSGSVNLQTQTFSIVGTAAEIETNASGQTLTIGLPDDVEILNNLDVGNDLSVGNDLTVSNNVTITGDLTVNGTTTYVNTTELNIGDNIITLNADLPVTSAPTQNSGIEVNRGTDATVSFVWDETSDRWSTGSDNIEAGEFFGTIDGGTF